MPNIDNICNSIQCIKVMSFINNCITVKLREKVLAELCLDGVNSPVSGFTRISEKVAPGETLELFNNDIDTSPVPNKQQVRGVFIIIQYPKKTVNGEDVEDVDKSSNIILTNYANGSFTLPVYNFYSLINNPVSENIQHLVNSMSIENVNDFNITIEALVLLADKTGVNTDPSSC